MNTKVKITWKTLPKQKFDAMMLGFGNKINSSDAIHISEDGITHTIYFKPHSNTNSRLHELGHSMLVHCDKDRKTWGDAVRMEIEAEAYRFAKLDRPLTIEITHVAIWLIMGEAKARPSETFNLMLENLRHFFIITPQAKSELWHYIKDFYQEYRIQKREGRLNW